MWKGGRQTVLAISGMKSNECRERLGVAIGRVPGVRDVTVSLIRAQAVVVYTPPCEPTEIVDAIVRAGYSASRAGGSAGA